MADELQASGWRQCEHLRKRIKHCVRLISQISSNKSPDVKATLPSAYEQLMQRVNDLLERA